MCERVGMSDCGCAYLRACEHVYIYASMILPLLDYLIKMKIMFPSHGNPGCTKRRTCPGRVFAINL